MNIEDEKFERLKDFWRTCTCNFCIVYQANQVGLVKHGNKCEPIIELKWLGAFSMEKRTPEEDDDLGAKYLAVAMHCYEHNRNLVLNENLPSANAKTQLWHGLSIRIGSKDPTPANSLGQRWWHLIVGSGATRRAGYVIVARVAAKEASELQDYAAKIQVIMGGAAESD
ncbi:MAG TPA: hypothetical protein VNV43_00285 [Candidatus Acidoferrales bacterium]|jgi:hypothetical protein|nr:hypothetical protein [Candidatus Acidoferrales bacterium]